MKLNKLFRQQQIKVNNFDSGNGLIAGIIGTIVLVYAISYVAGIINFRIGGIV